MMTISLSEVSKRFNRDWIFRHFTYKFNHDHTYAITGPNGSGKSTLLQVIGGAIALSEGTIRYEIPATEYKAGKKNTKYKIKALEGMTENQESNIQHPSGQNNNDREVIEVPHDLAFKHISITAPYLEVIEEMTAVEFLEFHHKFKPLLPDCTIQQILSTIGLQKAADKQIRYYSSGMKQRIKLAQAIFSDVPVLLLDEPCTNLDTTGFELYHHLIETYCKQKLIVEKGQ